MSDRERSESGQFVETVTLEGVLGVFDRVDGPVITSSDVADALECTTEAARQKLTRLYDQGRVDKRKTGRTTVWWRADDVDGPQDADGHGGARDGQQHAESAPEPSTGPTANTDAGDGQDAGSADATALEDVGFPGGRDRDECVAAVHAACDYLREHGGASMRELVVDVMPEHPVGYDAEKDVARINDRDARNRSTWWRKVVRPGLEALDDVEKPPQGASEWEYTGDGAEPHADEPPTSGDVYDPTEEF